MRSPLIDDTPLHAVQSRLFTELIRDSLVEYSYDADLAGLSYTFDSQADGILLTIDGYDDKLEVLSKVVFDTIKTLKVDKKRFDIIVDQVRLLSLLLVVHALMLDVAPKSVHQLPIGAALQPRCVPCHAFDAGDSLDSGRASRSA